jgi:predicted ABC-type ATPase
LDTSLFDRRPIVVAIAGPNGAGKSSFFDAWLRRSGLRFVNADLIARDLSLDAYAAARLADRIRRDLVKAGESFVFETVFSDPVGDKVAFLRDTAEAGHGVVLCFLGVESAAMSDERVCMRVAQGGHDVPRDKIDARFGRALRNLERAIAALPCVQVFDNSSFGRAPRRVALFEHGKLVTRAEPWPSWLQQIWPSR